MACKKKKKKWLEKKGKYFELRCDFPKKLTKKKKWFPNKKKKKREKYFELRCDFPKKLTKNGF